MGETASSWKLPLHSSDSEHEWQKRVDSKGKGGAFDLDMKGGSFPSGVGDPLSGIQTHSTQDCNPFDKDGK